MLEIFGIFETNRPARVNAQDCIDWREFWKGPIKHHEMPGKDSGDMLNGENARLLGGSLAHRLRSALLGIHPRERFL